MCQEHSGKDGLCPAWVECGAGLVVHNKSLRALQTRYTIKYMKRILSTAVLFVLLILTVVALTQMDANDTSALKPNTTASYVAN